MKKIFYISVIVEVGLCHKRSRLPGAISAGHAQRCRPPQLPFAGYMGGGSDAALPKANKDTYKAAKATFAPVSLAACANAAFSSFIEDDIAEVFFRSRESVRP